ncbi:hypothetical protein MMYC01_209819 [Madurella mycetomatis]|uniref:Mediator complex subunit 15 KIX domain-containing protein n=1 Tax=Madurella mycetomatis TaxID=100816 RepID=A0A175VT59_9PEZI|nr:hypothetical protein MMYC01_209819 [Madurella mycetomatis]
MAANMPQMAPNGQMMLQQQHPQRQQQQGRMALTAIITNSLMQSTAMAPMGSWQSSYSTNERYGKVMNLLSNMSLAAQDQQGLQKACASALEVEKNYFLQAPDRQSYDHGVTQKAQELFQRRQNNAAELQKQLGADAARQAQIQAQQRHQQMLLNQMAATRGLGQPAQHGFQAMPNQFPAMPQQPQHIGMGMPNPMMLQNRPEQRQFPMQMGQPRQPGVFPKDMNQLNQQEKALVNDLAAKMMSQTPEPVKHQYRQIVQQRLSPAQLTELTAANRDPVFLWFQSHAFDRLQKQVAAQRGMMQQRPGIPANMMAQAPHQGQMNPGLLNALAQPQVMPEGQMFPQNLESIRSEQQNGLRAQQAGQMVVPASTAPGRNATPGAMTSVPPQPTLGGQQGPNQTPRPPQMQQPFGIPQSKMDPAAVQAQAQSRAQAVGRTMQGQPSGIAVSAAASQSPAMNTINAPMRQTPLPMGQANGQAMNQAGQTLNPQFNHQNNTRPPSLQGNVTNGVIAGMMPNLTPGGPQDNGMRELMAKWEQRPSANQGLQGPKPGQAPSLPGQLQPGPMGGPSQAAMVSAAQRNGAGMPPAMQPPGVQQQQPNDRARLMDYMQSPKGQATMNSIDIPLDIVNRLRTSSNLPHDIQKWGQLKQFIRNNPAVFPHQLVNHLHQLQVSQFKGIWDKKMAAAALPGASQTPQGAAPQPKLQQNLPPGISWPPAIFQVAPHEVESFRKHPKAQALSDEALHEFIKRAKQDNFFKKSWAAYHAQNQANGNALASVQRTTTQIPQTLAMQQGAPTQQQNARQGVQPQSAPPKPVSAPAAADAVTTPASATLKAARPPPQQNRPTPQNPSPASAPKNLKRSSPDDASDVPVQASNALQRPPSQLDVQTQTGAANMSPDQAAQKAAAMRKHPQQNQPGPDYSLEKARLRDIHKEAQRSVFQEQQQEVAMSQPELQEMRHRITRACGLMEQLRGQGLLLWYRCTKDDARATMFFKMRYRIVRQFLDGEKFTQMRDSLTISKDELDQFINMTEGMLREVMRASQGPAASAQPGGQRPAQPGPAPAPLSAANLEKQTQALRQAQNRTSGKPGQPPAAPTTAQPPFQFGANTSPSGNPEYFSEQRITQANLAIPPRKKAKTTAAQKSPSMGQQQQGAGAPSPQVKAPSPTVGRKAEPTKVPPKLTCPEPGCEMSTAGFQSEEALNAHHQEEHVKPYENPYGFLREHMTATLGLDAQGHPKPFPKPSGQEAVPLAAPPMSASLSKQGQTPRTKTEPGATPMSREASMRRQGSAAGGKAGEGVSTPGRIATPRLGDSRPVAVRQEAGAPQTVLIEDPWLNSTIDPQSLFAPLGSALDLVTGNIMADFGTYRSTTPNDTPESSKDSGVSEPTSDIPEGSTLDIDMNLLIDNDFLSDMDKITMEGYDGLNSDMLGAESYEYLLDDMVTDFSKPFQLDTSLYSMDPPL